MDTLTTTAISDQVLVIECVNGDQQAWIQLLNRYKRLIYSVTVRFTLHDPRADTMQIYLDAERAELLREALEELPERCRSLLDLLFLAEDKSSYAQLGGLFGWSKDTIGSARLRCLDKLRKILEQKGF